ncbi:ABC transporter permease subunit [Undibacterium arcticum]
MLVYPSFTVPFCTWLMMGFFKAVPRDIEEAAMMDGLSRFGAFLKVVVPVSSAGILTVIIFTLTLVMQEFIYALTFITSSSQYTVSVGVPTFLVRGDVYFWGSLMGGLPDRECTDRGTLQFLRGPFRRGIHRRCDQVIRLLAIVMHPSFALAGNN